MKTARPRVHSSLVLPLALVLLAASVPVASATPVDLASFKQVQWETYAHHTPDFTLQYPYQWEIGKNERPGEIFTAYAGSKAPGISISLRERPSGLEFTDSALAAARQLSPGFSVESQRSVDLGGTPARVVIGRWIAPLGSGLPLRTMVLSAFLEQRWVLLFATDGVTRDGLLPMLEQAALSLRFGSAQRNVAAPPLAGARR